MKKGIVLLFLLFLFSCKSVTPSHFHLVGETIESKDTDCTILFQEINDNWAINDSFPCFHYNQDLLLLILKNKKCFVGLDTNDIIKLFGIPSVSQIINLEYDISPDCLDGDQYFGPFWLLFYFKNDIIKKIRYQTNYKQY